MIKDNKHEYLIFQIISLMICFYAMGSIEMVGIASNYVKVELNISDAKANLLPSLVYIWFIVCTVPTGYLMDMIGRKRTVILSMFLMMIAMIFPFFGDSYSLMICCFIFLGIGNVCMQTSLYPLISNVINENHLASNLTLGQFVKTLSSFSAPYVAMLGALYLTKFIGIGWRVLFVFYFIVTFIAIAFLWYSKIENIKDNERVTTYLESFSLLKHKFILLSFIGVICHVGIDISTNTIAPKLMMYRTGVEIEKASFAASLYFIARLLGCLSWSIFLKKVSRKLFFYISIALILFAMVGLYFAKTEVSIYSCIFMIGIGNANLFPVLFSQAVLSQPDKHNIISVLMIMGQAGGAVFPILMGLAFDKVGLFGSISVLLIGVAYLVFFAIKLGLNKSSLQNN